MPLLEPTGNGLGADCFALVWIERKQKLYGLNASGSASLSLNWELVKKLGFSEMPKVGWIPTMAGRCSYHLSLLQMKVEQAVADHIGTYIR